jgi:hypothetical protein
MLLLLLLLQIMLLLQAMLLVRSLLTLTLLLRPPVILHCRCVATQELIQRTLPQQRWAPRMQTLQRGLQLGPLVQQRPLDLARVERQRR